MTTLSAALRRPFAQQVAAFRLRLTDLRPTAKWTDVWQAEHDRAFMVAGALKADLLADLGAAVDRAISEGTSLETFRAEFRDIVERRGWHGWTGEGTKKGEAWRTRVIYRTNLSTSYAAGRMAQLVEANFPLWVYRHGGSLEPRIQHLGWDGLILPPSSPFWATHAPPNGWGCSCFIVGARSIEDAVRKGGKPGLKLPDGWDTPDPRTGAPPGIDKGWAYAPGRGVVRTVSAVGEKLAALPAPIGADLVDVWPNRLFEAWADGFSTFIDGLMGDYERGRHFIAGALRPEWVKAARDRGLVPQTAEIAVREADVRHTFRTSKTAKLDLDWYRRLPVHLRNPDAVILDTTRKEPAFLLIFGQGAGSMKLVIQVNYLVRKLGGALNVIETGKVVDTTGIGGPGLEVIWGSLGGS